ncbi:MAG TPA: biopolymer transporter ExbD [Planctomycetota bacterium]|jgi:biopolymer transport protein ExbD
MRKSTKNPHAEEQDSVGHNRPWVYFMIDCFFLVTQFFVLTFHVKVAEVVLPQKLPPGAYPPGHGDSFSRTVRVHVSQQGAALSYSMNSQPGTLNDLEAGLSAVRQASHSCTVKVSYDSDVPFGAVMAVFNACTKTGINQCGLVPLRG